MIWFQRGLAIVYVAIGLFFFAIAMQVKNRPTKALEIIGVAIGSVVWPLPMFWAVAKIVARLLDEMT